MKKQNGERDHNAFPEDNTKKSQPPLWLLPHLRYLISAHDIHKTWWIPTWKLWCSISKAQINNDVYVTNIVLKKKNLWAVQCVRSNSFPGPTLNIKVHLSASGLLIWSSVPGIMSWYILPMKFALQWQS